MRGRKPDSLHITTLPCEAGADLCNPRLSRCSRQFATNNGMRGVLTYLSDGLSSPGLFAACSPPLLWDCLSSAFQAMLYNSRLSVLMEYAIAASFLLLPSPPSNISASHLGSMSRSTSRSSSSPH